MTERGAERASFFRRTAENSQNAEGAEREAPAPALVPVFGYGV